MSNNNENKNELGEQLAILAQGDYCANCSHFEQLRAKGEHLRRFL